MKQAPQSGNNRTTRSQHPDMYEEMKRGPEEFHPSSHGDGPHMVAEVRQEYAKASGPLGHVPPLGKGEDEATVDLLDKLGERLAFERAGTRLYEALLSKYDAFGSFDGGPGREELEEIHRQEHEHFLMLEQVIPRLGGDPAAVTPSADLAATVGRGVQDVLTDPRTNLLQGLEAILVAELADDASWHLLVEMARRTGQTDLVRPFEKAAATEDQHVGRVLSWVKAGHGLG